MVELSFYLASPDIARRCGVLGQRYVGKDGRVLIDNNDLSMLRLKPSEYVSGITGIEMITEQKADEVISENGYELKNEVNNK